MTFDDLLTQILDLLQRQGRVSYGALRRRFALDEDYLEDIKTELIGAQRVAADEGGKILVWVGQQDRPGSSVQRREPEQQSPQSTVRSQEPRLSVSAPHLSDPGPWTLDPGQSAAERRQLTVMFCELGRIPTMEDRRDSEDWLEALRLARRACEEIIERYEGYLTQALGDGMVVYWGYPQAHEDDARRAVQAGLDLVRAVQHLDYWPVVGIQPVQVRVSIHTGPVIVEVKGGQRRQEPVALGPTPQVAVHLLGVAEPNTVVLGAPTYQLAAGYFTCRMLSMQVVPGLPEPIASYQVLSESGARHRLEAESISGLSPFIGREEESKLLYKQWQQLQEGRGHVVVVSGEAGIGKSRLIQELREYLFKEQSIGVEVRCSPYHQQSAFYPVIDYIQRSLQFGRDESVESKRQKLERSLVRARLEETTPVFAHLLGLPYHSSTYASLSPQRQREQLMHVIVAWFFSLAERKPVLTVWEDLHWADPSTLELLQLLLAQVPTTRILAVVTARPEFVPPWPPRSHVTALMLGRLGAGHAETMIANIAKGKSLPEEITRQIVEKTDGVPLFIEELTKMVLESGLVKEDARAYHLTGPLPPLAIPTTLQDSLLARLDRLGAAREVAQVGAVLGREFAPEVLHAVFGGNTVLVQQALDKLVAAEVLYCRGVTPQTRYVFKHALIRDVAYQSLLIGKRQQYHQQIARVLDEHFPEIRDTQPELVAHHYTEAGVAALAVQAWQHAGRRAIEQSAFVEATEHINTGLSVLRTLPETPERDQHELQLCTLLGPTLMALKGYSAPGVEEIYTRALTLCQRVGHTSRLFQVQLGLAFFHLARGQLQTARQYGELCFSRAQDDDKPLRMLQAHVVLANILFYQGEFHQSERHLREGIALYAAVLPQAPLHTLQDPGINTLTSLQAWTSWCLGYPDRAVQQSEEAIAMAQRLDRPLSQAIAAIFASGVRILRREEAAAQRYAEQAIMVATDRKFPLWEAYGLIMQGWAVGHCADPDDGIARIQQGLSIVRSLQADLVQSWLVLMLATVYEKEGKVAEGLTVIVDILAVVEDSGEHAFLAELYRLKGELLLTQEVQSPKSKVQSPKIEEPINRMPEEDLLSPQAPSLKPLVPSEVEQEIEGYFLKAIDIARQQQAKSWELRATMSLVRFRQQQYQSLATRDTEHDVRIRLDESRDVLRDVYRWFTEGFDTKDVQEAETLLKSLEFGVSS